MSDLSYSCFDPLGSYYAMHLTYQFLYTPCVTCRCHGDLPQCMLKKSALVVILSKQRNWLRRVLETDIAFGCFGSRYLLLFGCTWPASKWINQGTGLAKWKKKRKREQKRREKRLIATDAFQLFTSVLMGDNLGLTWQTSLCCSACWVNQLKGLLHEP